MEIKSIQDVLAATAPRYRNSIACKELAESLRVHAEGRTPARLINIRRPSEPVEIQEYRKSIYVPVTKAVINKVIHSLEKIRRAQDWCIKYDATTAVASVAEEETLQKYCEEKYPVYSSVTNWAFSELLRQSLIDANGIVAVIIEKENRPGKNSEYPRPVAKFFESSQIVDYVEDEYVVIKSKDVSVYYTRQGKGQRELTYGAIYYIITENEFVKYEQISKNKFEAKDIYQHNIGKLPAWKVGGLFLRRVNNDTIFESRIAAMVPGLDEAAREYSDLQAEIVNHIHSEKYAYTTEECPDCKGTGKIIKDGKQVTCEHCQGAGKVLHTSPYGMHLINPGNVGENAVPTPPIGYIQKDTNIAELQSKRVRDHQYDALAAINMEFLAEAPLSQSGTAKEVDKDELNNFVNSIAEDIVRNLDNVYYFINEYRYRKIVADAKKREAMLPKINVPTKFDIVSTTVAMEMLKSAKEANTNPEILREMEIDFAKKQFNVEPEIAQRVETTFTLDPLFGIAEENKMTMLQNGGIKKTDYIISCNIHQFVRRAIFEDPNFCVLEYNKQMEKLEEYAEEVSAEAEASAQQAAESDFGGLGQQPKGNQPTNNKKPAEGEDE